MGRGRILAMGAAILGISLAAIDFYTGPRIQFPALFMLPVGWAAWSAGRQAGFALAIALPLARHFLFHSSWEGGSAETAIWLNSAIRIATLLAFAELIHRLAEALRWRTRILESLPLGIWVVDRKGRVVMSNPAALEIWGGNPFTGPITEEGVRMWFHPSGRELSPWDWGLARAFLDGEATRDEVLDIERPDRSRRTVRNTAVPLRDGNGGIDGALLLQEDRTARSG